MTVHAREYAFVFSLNKQSAIGTDRAIANAKLNKMRSLRTFAPFREEQIAITDRASYGKQHPHPTFRDVIGKRYVVDAQERSASSLETLYAAAFVLGKIVTTQPATGIQPATYQHVVTFQDARTNKEVIYTTMGEEMGSEYKKRLSGAWLNSFTLTGNREDHVVLSFEGGGRQYADGTFTVPALTAASFYKTLFGKLQVGPAGGAYTDISTKILSWNLTCSQNAQPIALMGNLSGEEKLISEVLIGDQTVAGQFVVKIDVTERNRFLNEDKLKLEVTLQSPDVIEDIAKHKCVIELANLYLANEAFGEEGQTVVLTLAFSEDTVIKGASDEFVKFTFTSSINDSELLVVA